MVHNDILNLPESFRNLNNFDYICIRGTGMRKALRFLKNFRNDEFTQVPHL